MYSWEGLSFMTSTVGFPDRLLPETLACTNLENGKEKRKSEAIEDNEEKEKEQNLEGLKEAFNENKKETNGSREDCRVSNWKTVLAAKVGRSSPGHASEVQISASKFYVLTVDDIEEVE
ncbi:unnamed protein product [Brassica oleracea var. botrytis]|uniref:Uncharacterized protein n=1 Tax=Brassica oleracea TaxID=3712 RepID=A0A3P6GRV1_BRAOL|nr:unnamed protein product [Brassica oleracea]